MLTPGSPADLKFREAYFLHQSHELHRRIAAGEADPISDREREQLQELRAAYIERFGEDPDTGLSTRAPRAPKRALLPRWLTSAFS
jgi:hypothetical protein